MTRARATTKTKPKARAKAKPKTKSKNRKRQPMPMIAYEVIGLVLLGISVLMVFQLGVIGKMFYNMAEFLAGYMAFLIPLSLIYVAVYVMVKRKWPKPRVKVAFGSAFMLIGILLICHLIWAAGTILPITSANVLSETVRTTQMTGTIWNSYLATGGGIIGALLYALLHVLFDTAGTWVVAIILLSIGAIILTGKAAAPFIAEKIPSARPAIDSLLSHFQRDKPKKLRAPRKKSEPEQVLEVNESLAYEEEEEEDLLYRPKQEEPIISAFTENVKSKQAETSPKSTEEPKAEETQLLSTAEELENEEYQLPPLSLLTLPPHHDQSGEYSGIQKNAKKLEKTFQSFGVRAKVTQVHLGPAVTKYEVLPDTGVKVSKIVSLHDDLALALAARDIRIEAPIPGKSAIGIEVPNTEVSIVSLREVLESEENNRPDAKLLFALGRDVTGQAVMTELNKMPHLLVAGSTGSGKSVCINGIITSIIMRAKPHEVKMMMIDPKMVELNVYNGIPHLLAPVVTDPRKAAQALKKIVSEMERRYELFSHTGTRNIEGYNEYVRVFNEENEDKHPKLPFIVVIVDELADLMMVASNEVEDAITRLAQMARAAGIHLIIATQRPSVNVITGVIKANIPSRIAFAVSSSIDSRTILDMGGAEKLLGRGDMLFLGAGQSKPVRVQGAFLSDSEVEKIVDFVIEQQKAQYQEDMIPSEIDDTKIDEETDEIYDDAVQLVTEMQTASVSMLQRRFRVGYSRAARIVDQMEQRGVVGPYEGSKPRTVLVPKQEDH
ncbi:DNA translocase FtsK [Planococcus antarcticus DSM 14505]|uniref:Cell division protein FtsK n=1 Tax=Planococcus antarcticus DSM 14505 TaxID=1185653 RepID=A0A1C7DGN2_9BACL|nr:DNA translocase FtsK [Planococcus antarcticus]ANU10568.1 cell division protein FtsK [Planococcus antarcticus DSM 14505]EIM08356.1 DNA translocase FtsK [Planococcus antarcticus DSM 14505]